MAVVAAWTVVFLVLIDCAINVLFAPPRNPRVRPSNLQAYFDYGRSVRGKLARMIAPTDAASDPLMVAGWDEPRQGLPATRPAAGGLAVSVYGMSFSNHIAHAMAELDASINLRLYSGPAAPPNYCYGRYLRERSRDPGQVVILGILASSVQGMGSMTGLTWFFERPAPYTYPRFLVNSSGALEQIDPPVTSLDETRAALSDDGRWRAYSAALAAHDRFYNPLLVGHVWLDRSALLRMVRRAYALHFLREISARYETRDGMASDPEVGPVLRAMVRQFGASVRADGKVPVVLLIHDRPFEDQLLRLLGPVLDRDGIPYLSTDRLVPTRDPANFIADGHFTHDAYVRVARELLALIRARLSS